MSGSVVLDVFSSDTHARFISCTLIGGTPFGTSLLNLESAVESRKSAQALNAPRKFEKRLFTGKVSTYFSIPLFTSMSCTSFSRSTDDSRLKLPNLALPSALMIDERGLMPWIDHSDDYRLRARKERVLLAALSEVLGD